MCVCVCVCVCVYIYIYIIYIFFRLIIKVIIISAQQELLLQINNCFQIGFQKAPPANITCTILLWLLVIMQQKSCRCFKLCFLLSVKDNESVQSVKSKTDLVCNRIFFVQSIPDGWNQSPSLSIHVQGSKMSFKFHFMLSLNIIELKEGLYLVPLNPPLYFGWYGRVWVMDVRTIKCLAVNPELPAEPRLDVSHRQTLWMQDFFVGIRGGGGRVKS